MNTEIIFPVILLFIIGGMAFEIDDLSIVIKRKNCDMLDVICLFRGGAKLFSWVVVMILVIILKEEILFILT